MHLLHDLPSVGLDRNLADAKFTANFFVQQAGERADCTLVVAVTCGGQATCPVYAAFVDGAARLTRAPASAEASRAQGMANENVEPGPSFGVAQRRP